VFAIVMTQHRIDILATTAVIVGALFAGAVVHRLLFWVLARSVGRREGGIAKAVLRRSRGPLSLIFPLVAVLMVLPDANLPPKYSQPIEHLTTVLTYVAIGWGLTAMVGFFTDVTISRYTFSADDNLHAREVETRLFIVSRATNVLVWVLAIAAALMTFPSIRTLGATLLASAGLAGIAAGLAARPVFENLVAGLQIAFSQPIRLDDVVVVQGQQGRVEEIRDTFVVVKLVDMRRLILPLTWFIQNPFENWTRNKSELIGSVTIFAPYSFSVATMRDALPAILKETPLWDGGTQNVFVVDATENAIQIRADVSARNSVDLWNLRCFVRERLVAIVQGKPSA
jgi:small-conductance mechanosensitive channel